MLPWCQSSQVSVAARLERRSGSSGNASTGDTLPLCAIVVLLAGAARRLLASRLRPRGSAPSRESLTQDSRSAVKARLYFRSVTRIIRRGALHSSRQKTWRPRERPSRGFRAFVMRRNALESGADRGMRAYDIRGCTPNDDARAQRGVGAQRPHATACGELKARGTRAARRSRAHATARRRRVRGRARGMAGEACAVLQAPRRLGCNGQWQR